MTRTPTHYFWIMSLHKMHDSCFFVDGFINFGMGFAPCEFDHHKTAKSRESQFAQNVHINLHSLLDGLCAKDYPFGY